jgi:acylphosphatase
VIRAHLFVSGVVQGVFYRQSLAQKARLHKVQGWVRNLADGRVEAVIEGEEADVHAMIAWCRIGPEGAKVARVEEHLDPPEGEKGFEVRPTYR